MKRHFEEEPVFDEQLGTFYEEDVPDEWVDAKEDYENLEEMLDQLDEPYE